MKDGIVILIESPTRILLDAFSVCLVLHFGDHKDRVCVETGGIDFYKGEEISIFYSDLLPL